MKKQKTFIVFHLLFIVSLLLLQSRLSAQRDKRTYITDVAKLPMLNKKVTVKGYKFEETLLISKNSLRQGFELVLQDDSYQIVSFILAYECEACDLWTKVISASYVTSKEFRHLNSLKKGETLGIELLKVKRGRKAYKVPYLMIVVTD